jgi:hypothetical protein
LQQACQVKVFDIIQLANHTSLNMVFDSCSCPQDKEITAQAMKCLGPFMPHAMRRCQDSQQTWRVCCHISLSAHCDEPIHYLLGVPFFARKHLLLELPESRHLLYFGAQVIKHRED